MEAMAEEILLLIIADEVDHNAGIYMSTADRFQVALLYAPDIFDTYRLVLDTAECLAFREEGIALCNQGPPLFLTAEWKFKIHLAVMTVEEPW